ncbi:MAG: helix-turn-helix domain-containing protein [Lachnospiraceae bacterium]|nr:helix-turn-helix domain-containing protein [Lachnospiraceae bacterium]
MNIAENIKKARKDRGLKQADFAMLIGVRQKDVSRWENGKITPSIESVIKICKAVGISADVILGI